VQIETHLLFSGIHVSGVMSQHSKIVCDKNKIISHLTQEQIHRNIYIQAAQSWWNRR